METKIEQKKLGGSLKKTEKLIGILLVLPAVFFFTAFVFYPAIRTFTLSFFKWDRLSSPQFVGWSNFAKLLTDEKLGTVIINTLILTVCSVLLKITLGFLTAYLVFRLRNRFGKVFMEGAIFFPIIIPMSIVAMVFGMLFATDTGAINGYLFAIGLPKVEWLTSHKVALISIIIVDVWKGLGFFFIIYLVAMRNIPQSYIEAAQIDGANGFTQITKIILPGVSSTSLFLSINAIITSLQLFDPVRLLTSNSVGDAMKTISYYVWEVGINNGVLGYGSVLALVLFVFVMAVTAAQFAISRLWVHYEN